MPVPSRGVWIALGIGCCGTVAAVAVLRALELPSLLVVTLAAVAGILVMLGAAYVLDRLGPRGDRQRRRRRG